MVLQEFDHRWLEDHRFGLVDASWRDELPVHWPQQVVAPSFLGADTGRCPVLIDLQALSAADRDSIAHQLAQQAQKQEPAVCSWLIRCELSLSQLAGHLAHRLAVRTEPQEQPKQFRYFDPGTTLQLPSVLGAQGLSWLLGPITSVWVPWAGHWTYFERQDPPPAAYPWTKERVEGLLLIGVVNRVAARLAPPQHPQAWIEECQRIAEHAQRVQTRHGVTHQADLVEFAWHAMVHHPRFDSHPHVAELLRRLRSATPEDELDYRELTVRISRTQWASIAADLKAASENLQTTEQP